MNSKLFATLTNDLGFLGWPATSDAHYLSDFEEATRQIRVGDEVVFVDFFQNASKMVVMLKKHKHFEEPIMEVLMTEFEKQDKILIKDIEANQVVACQWSEDEGYYRAVVKKVGHKIGTIHLRRRHFLGGEGCPHVPMVERSQYIRIKNPLHKHFAGMPMVGV